MGVDKRDSEAKYGEISLKGLILKARHYLEELIRNWKLFPLFIFPLVVFMMLRVFLSQPSYPAKLTFMVNEDEGQTLGSISGVLGQFGLSSAASEYNLDRILELLKSLHITKEAIFQRKEINGSTDYLANHLINNLDSLDKWATVKWYLRPFRDMEKVHQLKTFRFKDDFLDHSDHLVNRALKAVYRKLIGDPEMELPGMLDSRYSESSGIMSITTSCFDQNLSIALTNEYFMALSNFYIEKTIEKQQNTFNIIKSKYDSIQTELETTQFSLASFRDKNANIFTSASRLEEKRLENKVAILSAGLIKATENLELADFALQNKTPFIQKIDSPLAPIRSDRKSLFGTLTSAFIIGFFLCGAFILGRLMWREIMQ